MNLHDIILWYTPAVAWVVLWTQFVTLRFYDKNESLFKDVVSSGAKDLAISSIEADKLVPALAKLCDAVADAKAGKTPKELKLLTTEAILNEVDFLPHFAEAEAALREEKSIQDILDRLQQLAAALWKLGLAHSLAVISLPVSFLIPSAAVRVIVAGTLALVVSVTFVLLIIGVIRYHKKRDELNRSLSINRKAS